MTEAAQPTMTTLARDLPGAEGPCTTPDGTVYLVASGRGEVLVLEAGGAPRTVAATGGVPAGLQLDRDGSLLVADMRLGILRVRPESGAVEDVVRDYAGAPIRGCNDLAFDTAGNLYFTAPAGSSADDPCGEVFCRLADGAVRRLDGGYAFCNGLAVSGDDRLLVVAETRSKRLWAYDVKAPGVLGEARTFATASGDHWGGPDGMDFDAEGHLIVANHGAGLLEIFGPDGEPVRQVGTPFDKPSNVHFAAPGATELLVTEHTESTIRRFDYGVAGQPQYGWQTA